MIGRGGGDRTPKGIEDVQVIDSMKQQKREKTQKRRTEVHAGYTGRIVFFGIGGMPPALQSPRTPFLDSFRVADNAGVEMVSAKLLRYGRTP
jgi:hypothetical protein